ncbi:MAG: AAA family ATPase [Lachnospiraceae bacterium]|nr:AAA family ATPase [Lachnospiraceae bacterium]
MDMTRIPKQKLVIIAGSPCVGKTTVAEKLFTAYENSAFFDGDWAWRVNPFSINDPRLRNGNKTMSYALSTYLNSCFDYVFFSSVVAAYKETREAILNDVTANEYSVLGFTLTCSEDTLLKRHKKRGDKNECSFFWLHLAPCEGDYVINTDNKSVQQVVDEIKCIVDEY